MTDFNHSEVNSNEPMRSNQRYEVMSWSFYKFNTMLEVLMPNFKKIEPLLKFETRLKHDWFHLKLFQDLNSLNFTSADMCVMIKEVWANI